MDNLEKNQTEVTDALTDEQVKMIHDKLEENNNEFKSEDNEKIYDNITEIGNITDISVTGINSFKEPPSEKNYIEALEEYELSPEEAKEFIEVINDYSNNNVRKNIYNRLPGNIKKMCRNMHSVDQTVTLDAIACLFMDTIINDASISKALDDFNKEMNEINASFSREFNAAITDNIDSILENIDEIKKESPEVADRLIKVKEAFNLALSFEKQIEYLTIIPIKKLRKYNINRFENDAYYFNKRVNKTPVRIPDISQLPDIVMNLIEGVTKDEAVAIISSIIHTTVDLEIEGDDNIHNLSYIYRLVTNIYNYKYKDPTIEEDDKIFNKLITSLNESVYIVRNKLNN